MMRVALTICGLVVCLHGAQAAGTRVVAKRLGLSATVLRNMQTGLSPAARQSLAGTITREQQLMVLRSNPEVSKRLQNLGVGTPTQVMSNNPWETGITLTPLTSLFPGDANYETYQLSLQTRAAYLSPFWPLPTASQNPPLLWLNVAANTDPLFWIEAKWPSTGAYLLTFFMKDLWPNSPARPRVWVNGVGMQNLVGNASSGGDRWTVLWEANNPQDLSDEVSIHPVESGFGFTCCCLSKVVITKAL